MSSALLDAPDRVLSTLNKDGSRRWLRPRPSRGRFWRARRSVASVLMAVFFLLPYIQINGRPAILLDIPSREFSLFGKVFLPTDTVLLALLLVGAFVTIFGVTALLGRVWCGWACPQTVYMEFLFRPIERLLEGEPGRPSKATPWRRGLKLAIYVVLALFLAHTFLAYFVGVERLAQWVRQSPLEHPTPFLVMAITTGLILFDFGYFREQTCIVACPYGRFQSVMLDRDSMIVTYDRARGEPRGKPRRETTPRAGSESVGTISLRVLNVMPAGSVASGAVSLLEGAESADRRGDCVDCGLCVATCPTGIDIREGLQMECIGCSQCIDACDAVMAKLKRDPGLIRYSSQNGIEGKRHRVVRPRVVLYTGVVSLLATLFVVVLLTSKAADVALASQRGSPFAIAADGSVINQLKLKITNRARGPASYTVSLVEPAEGRIITPLTSEVVEPGVTIGMPVTVSLPREALAGGGRRAVLRVTDGSGFETVVKPRLVGPMGVVVTPKDQESTK